MSSEESEVARIRRTIAMECEALRLALHGPAIVASHATINAHYRHIDRCTRRLTELVGEPEATATAIDLYIDIVK